ncbi:hypothetical protein D3C78_1886380 [compost metagenome]
MQIGAFTSVLGQVSVGDDVFFGPGCIITSDVPSGSWVKLKTSLQVSRSAHTDGGLNA